MKTIARIVWNMAEYFDIPLGRLAPWVVGAMMGCWPRRKK